MPKTTLYYDRYGVPKYLDLPITIFGSSSAGNSILYQPWRLLIDMGFSQKKYPDDLIYHLSYIALTHEHSDHLNWATLKYVYQTAPWIKILSSQRLFKIIQKRMLSQEKIRIAADDPRFIQLKDDHPLVIDDLPNGNRYRIQGHSTHHGSITNMAYELTGLGETAFGQYPAPHMMYASDLDKLTEEDGVPGLPTDPKCQFDILFLEANYDLNEVLDILKEKPGDPKALGNLRHISEQAAFQYVNNHLKADGAFVPLHASPTFGSFRQNLVE